MARKGDCSISRIPLNTSNPHFSVFRASFGEGAQKRTVQGADTSFISAELFREIIKKVGRLNAKSVQPLQINRGVTGDPCLTCVGVADMNVFLKIRNGSRHILRDVNWKRANEDIPSPTIGRRVLKTLVCDNRETLLAARDRYGDSIDVADCPAKDGNQKESKRTIVPWFGETVFHNGGQIEDVG